MTEEEHLFLIRIKPGKSPVARFILWFLEKMEDDDTIRIDGRTIGKEPKE